jgi:hypothetical protein
MHACSLSMEQHAYRRQHMSGEHTHTSDCCQSNNSLHNFACNYKHVQKSAGDACMLYTCRMLLFGWPSIPHTPPDDVSQRLSHQLSFAAPTCCLLHGPAAVCMTVIRLARGSMHMHACLPSIYLKRMYVSIFMSATSSSTLQQCPYHIYLRSVCVQLAAGTLIVAARPSSWQEA